MNFNWLEWLGYLASLIVLTSLLMSSIIKLRWISLLGSLIFSVYGFLIGALPVGFMNLCIAFINAYYLVKIYKSKEYFKILPISGDSAYFEYFLDFYNKEIRNYTNAPLNNIENFAESFYILRNMVPAGIFIASQHDKNTLKIELDFVIPEYRDFKIGKYIYQDRKDYFQSKGYSKFISTASKKSHKKFYKKMGFKETMENGSVNFIKIIS